MIMDFITHAAFSIKQLRQLTLNAYWEKILPACVKSGSFVIQKSIVCSEITTLSKAIGGECFNNMQAADIDELMLESLLHEDDLKQFLTVYDNKEDDHDEVEDEV
ncbi:hypothetical protein TNCV_4464951 [Trichonephila clavipes]|nr:hypothetical protein TNCV_4464951 [Trichonephila clavipes]